MDANQLPTCDVCNQHIFQGSFFFHCTACSLDPGFDACHRCFGPEVHRIHKPYIESGVYPAFNPYVNICRLCQLPRVEPQGKSKVKVSNRIDVIKVQLGVDAIQDSPDLPKFICKSCDNRLWRLRKDQTPPMTLSQFRRSVRQNKKSRRQSQEIAVLNNDDVQILQSIENKQVEVLDLGSSTDSVPFEVTDVRRVSNLEQQRIKLKEVLRKNHGTKPKKTSDPSFPLIDDTFNAQKGDEESSSDIQILNVISITDSEEDSDGKTDNHQGAPSDGDVVYDYQCMGTISLVRQVGTEILEFVYDEVLVEIASNKKGISDGQSEQADTELIESNDPAIYLEKDDELESVVELEATNGNTPSSIEDVDFTRNVFDSLQSLVRESLDGGSNNIVAQDIAPEGTANKTVEMSTGDGISPRGDQRTNNTEQLISIVDVVSQSLSLGDNLDIEMSSTRRSTAGNMEQFPNSTAVECESSMQNENTSQKHSDKSRDENQDSENRSNTETEFNTEIQSINKPFLQKKSLESNIIVIQPIPQKEQPTSRSADNALAQEPAKRLKLNSLNQIPHDSGHRFEIVGTDDKHIRSDTSFDSTDGARSSCAIQAGFPPTICGPQNNRDVFTELTAVPFPVQQFQQSNQQKYRCQICRHDVHGTAVDFHKHLRMHTGDRPWSCATCRLTFNLSKSLRQHLQEYSHKSGAFTFGHILLEELEQRFPNEFKTEGSLFVGESDQSAGRGKSHCCTMCDNTFYFLHELRQHELGHIAQLPSYPCTMCQAQLPNVVSLQDHVKQAHNVDYIMFCSLCKRGFLHVSQYDLHHERYGHGKLGETV